MQANVVTITSSISPANMPYNDFALYRSTHGSEDVQNILILYQTHAECEMPLPDNIKIQFCGTSFRMIRKTVHEIITESKRKDQPVIFHIHEGKAALLFTLATFGRYRKQCVYTVHNTYSRYPLHNKLLTIFASIFSGKAVCVSKTSFQHFPAWLKKITGQKVICIQNGVDCERIDHIINFSSKDEVFLPSEKKLRLIYTARLIAFKKQDILLHALQNLPDCELFLVGKGNQEESLKTLAQKIGVSSRVHFLGMIPREEVFRWIKSCDVYVSSSSYEGLPISVLEAMSCGAICAVSDIEQHREIREQCSSLITVKNTSNEWVKTIDRIAGMTPEQRKQIGAQNKKDVDRCFSLARMHQQYDRVYDEIAGELQL